MSVLVYAEHDNASLKGATLNAVTAAKEIGGDITVLVAGSGCAAVADEAAKIDGVSKVLLADNEAYGHQLAENVGDLVAEVGKEYSHILATATTSGKNFLPRVAALLDVQMISEISAVVNATTFQRPIYAGNAIATVESSQSIN
ncbi:MAG: electron transfer flavoprotein subunit alpha/FixB family protein, partial [Ketobacter sp.]